MPRDELRRLIEALARWAGLTGVPAEAAERAAWIAMDTVGVILRGALEPQAAALMERAAERSGGSSASTSTLLAPKAFARTTPEWAALANATAGTFLELDEGQRPTGHPAIHVLPAALAEAEALARSGAELLGAFLAGYELSARLFRAVTMRKNIHPHGHIGAMGAALAVGMLRRLRPPALEQAVRIAGTLPLATTWEPCFEGATARNAFTGLAARIGILAVDLAEAGFTGQDDPVGEIWGWVLGEGVDAARLVDGIAESGPPEVAAEPHGSEPGSAARPVIARPAVLNNYFKRHACCAANHPALDAIASLGERLPADWRSIERVEVRILERYTILGREYRDNPLSAKFSLPYAVAALLVDGRADLSAFAPEAVTRPEIRELSQRVFVRADPHWTARWPEVAGATVEIRLRDGRVLEGRCEETRWGPNSPPSLSELQGKFLSLAGEALPAEQAARLMRRLLDLARLENVRHLFDDLLPRART